ncbi:MAG: hypothetical protein JXB14_04385, partial [Candidatus Altiarchaeota archaeon]|nr:hypothetical protein [Candidatus Altiarchaeota archaeon]
KVFAIKTEHRVEDLWGLEDADTLCNMRASEANISGDFKAWISDPSDSAWNRLHHSTVPYKLPSGITIADNWDELVSGQLKNPIDEWVGEAGDGEILTRTDDSGFHEAGDECTSCLVLDRNDDGVITYDYDDKGEFEKCMSREKGALRALTKDTSRQELQGFRYAISGDKVVWKDWRSGGGDIYMYDLTNWEETQITTSPLSEHTAAISGNYIVYYQRGIPPPDWPVGAQYRAIFYYDITTGQETRVYPVADGEYADLKSVIAIDGDKIVIGTYVYDIPTGQLSRIRYVGGTQAISGNRIIGLDTGKIYMCDLSKNGQPGGCLDNDTRTQITKSPHSVGLYPYISGDKIVWQGYESGSWDIWMCDLSKNGQPGGCGVDDAKTRVTNDPTAEELYPVVSGEIVAWYTRSDQIWMCNLSKNGQRGGCGPNDMKTSLGYGSRRHLSISGNRIVFDRYVSGYGAGNYENWDPYIYDPHNNPYMGCEWADLDEDMDLDINDKKLFDYCYYGKGSLFGGSVVTGNSTSATEWSDAGEVAACGNDDRMSLYCIEQPPSDCEGRVNLYKTESDRVLMTQKVPSVKQWPNATAYYTMAGGVVPMGPQAALFILDTETYIDFLFTGSTVDPEDAFKKLSKFDYRPIVWRAKVNSPIMESLDYVFRNDRFQMVFISSHGGPSSLQVECHETQAQAEAREAQLNQQYGNFFMTDYGCTYGLYKTGWTIWMLQGFFWQRPAPPDRRKALVYSMACQGGGITTGATNANDVVGATTATDMPIGVDTYDLEWFMEFFLTEERHRPNEWDRIGEPLHDIYSIFTTMGTRFNTMDEWKNIDGRQPYFLWEERFLCYDTIGLLGNRMFCMTRRTDGLGPTTSPSPRVTTAYSQGMGLNTPIRGAPNSSAPVEIIWDGCIASWERDPSQLRNYNWTDGQIANFTAKFNLPIKNPFDDTPRWATNPATRQFQKQFSTDIYWNFSWMGGNAYYGAWMTPAPFVHSENGEFFVPTAGRILDSADWWGGLNDSQRENWPENRFLKIRLKGDLVASWPAGIKLNGNPNTHLGLRGIYLEDKKGKNLHGTYDYSSEDFQKHYIVPVWLRNAINSYGKDFEYWIPCQAPRIVPT